MLSLEISNIEYITRQSSGFQHLKQNESLAQI